MRLTTNPGESAQRIGVLPQRSTIASARSAVPASVSRPITTSTSGMSGAGLKKCRPTMRDRRDASAAIEATGSALVFVARIVSVGARASSVAKTTRLSARSSTAASITRKASCATASSVPTAFEPADPGATHASAPPSSRPNFDARRVRPSAIRALACSTAPGTTS